MTAKPDDGIGKADGNGGGTRASGDLTADKLAELSALKEASDLTLRLWIATGSADDRLYEAYGKAATAAREWRDSVTVLNRLTGKTTPEPPNDWTWTPGWGWQPTGTWPPKQGS